jgi:hypothetical protein
MWTPETQRGYEEAMDRMTSYFPQPKPQTKQKCGKCSRFVLVKAFTYRQSFVCDDCAPPKEEAPKGWRVNLAGSA